MLNLFCVYYLLHEYILGMDMVLKISETESEFRTFVHLEEGIMSFSLTYHSVSYFYRILAILLTLSCP